MEDLEEETRRWLEPDETAGQLLRRTYVQPLKTGLPLVDRFIAFRGGQVLEIASAAGVGRTTALLQVAATCILPEALHSVAFGGMAANVLLFDLDGKLDIVRMLEMLDARIYQALEAARVQPPADTTPLLLECLARLHVVRCHSSFDFLASLRTLRPTLDRLAAAPGGLACLLIDNVAAFHYLDKAARGAPAGYASSATGVGGGWAGDITREGAPGTLHRVHAAVAAELRSIQQRHRLPVIATKHLLFTGGRGEGQEADPWQHRDTMMKPWLDLVTHRLLLRAEEGSGGAVLRLAKWHTPEDPVVLRFGIGPAGIHLS